MVLIYHVFYIFNGVNVPGSIPGAANVPTFDTIACIIYPWFMVLLFVVAGMSARYALQKRTGKQFIKERAVKLLVPSTLGLFVVHWITGYLNIKMGGGLEYIPKFLIYPISAISGIGPLWFIQMLVCVITFPSDWSCIASMAILYIGANRGNFKKQMAWMMAWTGVYALVYFFFIDRVYGIIQLGTCLTIPFLRAYNGERGSFKGMGKLFYVYYPLHLVLCGIVRILLWGVGFSTGTANF